MKNPAAIQHKVSSPKEVLKGKRNGKTNLPYLRHRKKIRHDVLRGL